MHPTFEFNKMEKIFIKGEFGGKCYNCCVPLESNWKSWPIYSASLLGKFSIYIAVTFFFQY
jgi:hypothetical protein